MMNLTLYNDMIKKYNDAAFTHEYMFGFNYKGNVYMATVDASILPVILCLDKASRGAGFALRFKPNNAQKLALLPSAELICSVKFFNELYAESKYNRGEIFEKLVTEKFGQVWEKDNVPFTEAGDIEVDGIAYQIKYEKATFCNEKSLQNLA